jgi:DNA-binding GntR family transcriptional regulator
MFPWLDPDADPASTRLRAVRDTSLPKLVRDDLLERILGGELRPGDRISEPDVSARLSVSRVPV